jgi:alcohol dehydrogenase class IV
VRRIAAAIGVDNAPRGLFELVGQLGAPRALKDIGMPREGIDHASELATCNPYPNPEPVTRAGIHDLLKRAFDGRSPA